MDQSAFTKKVISDLLLSIPDFYRIDNENSLCDAEILSKKSNLAIWVGTEDMEITIGLSGERSSGWHMHLNRFKECILDEEIEKMITFIQSVLDDERPVFYSTIYGYTLNSSEYVLNHVKPDEIIESIYWSEL